MTEFDLTVRRSALLMWLLAVVGVPFIIFGVDLLFERRLATQLTEIIYPSERVTPPPFETHELAWAWVLLIAGAAMTAWALKELIAPRRIIHADARGVAFAVAGPLAASVRLPWTSIGDVAADIGHDEGGAFPVLRVAVGKPEQLPIRPWGARWMDDGALAIAAGEWDVDVELVADRLGELKEHYHEEPEETHIDAAVTSTWTDEVPVDPTPVPAPPVDGPWVRPDAEQVSDQQSSNDDPAAVEPDETIGQHRQADE